MSNVGLAIVISIAACVVIYTLVGFTVAGNLSLSEIIATRDYSLAAAARPALGEYGVWFTVAIAMMATAGGIIASIFAVSRMLSMLSEMKLVPHRHFGMPGSVQNAHTGLHRSAGSFAYRVFRLVPHRRSGHHLLSGNGYCITVGGIALPAK